MSVPTIFVPAPQPTVLQQVPEIAQAECNLLVFYENQATTAMQRVEAGPGCPSLRAADVARALLKSAGISTARQVWHDGTRWQEGLCIQPTDATGVALAARMLQDYHCTGLVSPQELPVGIRLLCVETDQTYCKTATDTWEPIKERWLTLDALSKTLRLTDAEAQLLPGFTLLPLA